MSILFARVESVSNELTQLQEEMKRIEAKRQQERKEKLKEQQKLKDMQDKLVETEANGNGPQTISQRQVSTESMKSTEEEYIMVHPPLSSVIV